MIKKFKLSKDEQWIEDHAHEFVPVSKKEHDEVLKALEEFKARRKDAVLNIRVNSSDLKVIKEKAKKIGVKYQTYISEVLHKVAISRN